MDLTLILTLCAFYRLPSVLWANGRLPRVLELPVWPLDLKWDQSAIVKKKWAVLQLL